MDYRIADVLSLEIKQKKARLNLANNRRYIYIEFGTKKEKEQKIIMAAFVFYIVMRPKARGLAQHGGLPGWLEESDPAGVILLVMEGPYRLSFPSVPVALTRAAQL